MLEAFLINPPKGMRRARRRNVAQGFYDSVGQFHPVRAASDYDPGRIGEVGKFGRGGRTRKGKSKKISVKVKKRGNPLGEEVIILNPRGKRVRRRRRVKAANPRRVYRRRRVKAANPRRVYRSRKVRAHNRRRHNPIRRHYRRRRNPAIAVALGYGFGDLIKLAIVGATASIATTAIPRALGLADTTKKYLGQGAVAIGGGLIVAQLVKKEYGGIWAVAGLAVIVADVMRQYVLERIGLPGLAAYPAELSGYPSEYYLSDGGAYPMVPSIEAYDSEQVF